MRQKHILLAVMLIVVVLVMGGSVLLLSQNPQTSVSGSLAPTTTETTPIETAPVETTQQEETAAPTETAKPEFEDSADETQGPNQTETEAPSELEPTKEALAQQSLDDALAQLHQAQERYIVSIDQLKKAVETEYIALPADEQTSNKKISLVEARLDEISAMEKECDTEVEALLLAITKAQLVLGDTEMVNEIRSYYADMKAAVKADYLSELSNS